MCPASACSSHMHVQPPCPPPQNVCCMTALIKCPTAMLQQACHRALGCELHSSCTFPGAGLSRHVFVCFMAMMPACRLHSATLP